MRTTRISIYLGCLMGLLLILGGCAQSPHYLQVDPKVGHNLPRLGSGQSVTVNVVDGRDSDIMGTRSGAAMSSAVITVEAHNLMPKLQHQAEIALTRMGFEPTTQPADDRPSVTLTLTELSYSQDDAQPLIDKAQLLARMRAQVVNDRNTYNGVYTAKREQTYAVKPDLETNARMVTDLLSSALDRAFGDPKVGNLLAR